MQIASKKVYWKKQQCSKHLHHITTEKYILSELNRCIFQISLKYIKLVILSSKILFILVLCSFNFYLKIMWPTPNKSTSLLPKIKTSDTPSKDFSEIFTPPPSSWRGRCMPWVGNIKSGAIYNHWLYLVTIMYLTVSTRKMSWL